MTLSKERLRVISQNIRNARIERGLTQEEIAESVGVSTEYYGQIESGNKAPSLETLLNIAECMNVSIDFLVYGSENKGLNNIIRVLSQKEQVALSKIEKLLYLINDLFLDK